MSDIIEAMETTPFFAAVTLGRLLWAIGIPVGAMILWALIGEPKWKVWASHQEGLADLTRARNEQQIQIAEAQSRLDAAHLNKQAAIIEAEAVSAQIREIGAQLTAHDLYLRWQWIKMMDDSNSEREIIYVPTEANLPVLESMRLKH